MIEFIDPMLMPVVLSFLFIFAIVFGLMTSANPMKFPKSVNAVVAVVFAAFSAAYEPFVLMMQEIMPFGAAFLSIIFFVVFVKKLFGEKKAGEKSDLLPIGVVMVVLLVIMGVLGNRLAPYLPSGIDPTGIFWILGIAIILGIFWIGYKKNQEK